MKGHQGNLFGNVAPTGDPEAADAALVAARKRARRNDPATSKLAALTAGALAERHAAAILEVLRMQPAGGTKYEVAEWIDRPDDIDHHAVGRRLGELETQGLVERTHETRPSPRKGRRPCTVWRARVVS